MKNGIGGMYGLRTKRGAARSACVECRSVLTADSESDDSRVRRMHVPPFDSEPSFLLN